MEAKVETLTKPGSTTDLSGSNKNMTRIPSITKRDLGSKSGIEIRSVAEDNKPSAIVASSVVAVPAVEAPVKDATAKDASGSQEATKEPVTNDASKASPSVDVAPSAVKVDVTPIVTDAASTTSAIKIGDRISLHATCTGAPGDGGLLAFVQEGKGKSAQRVLAVPPTQGEAHQAVFIIAPLAGTATASELKYNQQFYLHVVDAKGGVQSLNNDPPGAGDFIGLQKTGAKGEMTCYFSKPNGSGVVKFDDADLVITVHDSNRTRKHFNNPMTYYKRLKGTPGGYLSSAKKGTAVTFSVRQADNSIPPLSPTSPVARDSIPNVSRASTIEKADVEAAAEAKLAVEIAQPQEAYMAPEIVLTPTNPSVLKQESSDVRDEEVVKMDNQSSVIQNNEKPAKMADGPVIVAPPTVSQHLAAMKPVARAAPTAPKSLVVDHTKTSRAETAYDDDNSASPAACAGGQCCTIS
ncbi:hypothetical protein SPRG_05327 [Saprolegnia parasitica CBS 223.65]|uniref:Uncharacterized protein n=1 Tax=Saprolegnia parasitica (strain CBS 223.65) TaxID=695850 RepID=A0A067CLQ3_SAPPC|nr:hypothetical protein SPRG_05327 [Saprolegnia parasitica CBS 223.65]KDO30135.1 hypothetical protein SPRG_05327 [Saprolegnia parasitica CBS 223.65]|eukprot:XP_012199313.1 hypothetical protein SPRG_05327 [Saprolegnia parasitica CBS 223.65]